MNSDEARRRNAVRLAERLIYFADGAEEGGLVRYARKARVVAGETLWLAQQLELVSRSCALLVEQRDVLLGLVLKGVPDEEPAVEDEQINIEAPVGS